MSRTAQFWTTGLCFLWLAPLPPLAAQEAGVGVSIPFTVTGGLFRTDGLATKHSGGGHVAAAYRVVAYPTLKLGPNWFAYSAIQVSSRPSSYSGTSEYDSNVQVRVLQGFVARTWTGKSVSATLKAGQLASTFGSFPLRYDDMFNPLLDQPLGYQSFLRIRPDQLPCGVTDLARQWKNYRGGFLPTVRFGCGGEITPSSGMLPVTLYGLPGAEIDIAFSKVDARVQATNSSPANSQTLLSRNQHVQWAAGAGYTIREGFRIGFSSFRGPYLDGNIADLLPGTETVRDYPASGLGADVQWARGRWSTETEWQRFQFRYPRFIISPAVSFGYTEWKTILTPRLYAATRLGYEKYNAVEDRRIKSGGTFLPGRRSYEFALGYRPNRWQLLKIGYQRLRLEGNSGVQDNVLGVQLVTSIQSISKSLRAPGSS